MPATLDTNYVEAAKLYSGWMISVGTSLFTILAIVATIGSEKIANSANPEHLKAAWKSLLALPTCLVIICFLAAHAMLEVGALFAFTSVNDKNPLQADLTQLFRLGAGLVYLGAIGFLVAVSDLGAIILSNATDNLISLNTPDEPSLTRWVRGVALFVGAVLSGSIVLEDYFVSNKSHIVVPLLPALLISLVASIVIATLVRLKYRKRRGTYPPNVGVISVGSIVLYASFWISMLMGDNGRWFGWESVVFLTSGWTATLVCFPDPSWRMKFRRKAHVPRELAGVIVAPDTASDNLHFKGTEVPVSQLLDMVADGQGIDDFFKKHPDVKPDQAKLVLRWMQNNVRHFLRIGQSR